MQSHALLSPAPKDTAEPGTGTPRWRERRAYESAVWRSFTTTAAQRLLFCAGSRSMSLLRVVATASAQIS